MSVMIPAVAGKVIHIGRAGENLATTVTFDVSDWIRDFGLDGGGFSLFVQQGEGQIYPQNVTLSNNIIYWNITSSNTAIIGTGKCELVYSIQENGQQEQTIVKSIIYDIVVTNSLDIEAQDNIPSAIDSWLNDVSEMIAQISGADQAARDAAMWATGNTTGTPSATNNAKYYSDIAGEAVYKVGEMRASASTGIPGDTAEVNINTETDEYNKDVYSLEFVVPRGAVFWTTTTAPSTSPSYTFTISNLSGPSGITPSVGDVILYSYYWYSISSVSTTTVLASQRTTFRGATGATGTAAGFGTPTVTIDDSIGSEGTPGVSITTSGTNTSKIFNFKFGNLKGDKGDKGDGFAGRLDANNMPVASSSYQNKLYLDSNNHIRYVTQTNGIWSWQDNGTISGIIATLYDWT